MEEYTVTVYEDATGGYRWRINSSNGEIVGAASVGYKLKRDCVDNMVAVSHVIGEWMERMQLKALEHLVDVMDVETNDG